MLGLGSCSNAARQAKRVLPPHLCHVQEVARGRGVTTKHTCLSDGYDNLYHGKPDILFGSEEIEVVAM